VHACVCMCVSVRACILLAKMHAYMMLQTSNKHFSQPWSAFR